MKIYKTRHFERWAKKSGLSDKSLIEAVAESHQGLVDAYLGGYLIKKRVALAGRGKRSGARTIVATNFGECCHFIYGFEKNEKANISGTDLENLRAIASDLMKVTTDELSYLVAQGKMLEIKNEN